MFRKALFGGFREGDVLEYIRGMHEKVAGLEQELKSLRADLKNAQTQINEQNVLLDSKSKENAGQAEQIRTLREEYERLKAVEDQMLAQKREYEERVKIAEQTILDAKEQAKNIMSGAAGRAQELEQEIRYAYIELSEILKALNGRAEDFLAKARELLREEEVPIRSTEIPYSRPIAEQAPASPDWAPEEPAASPLENELIPPSEPVAFSQAAETEDTSSYQHTEPLPAADAVREKPAFLQEDADAFRFQQAPPLPVLRIPEPSEDSQNGVEYEAPAREEEPFDSGLESGGDLMPESRPEDSAPPEYFSQPAAPAEHSEDDQKGFKALESLFADDEELLRIIANLRSFGAGQA